MSIDLKSLEVMHQLESGNTNLFCGKHDYFPGEGAEPIPGCAGCWKAQYVSLYFRLPPEKRKEFVERLEEALYKAVELSAKGQWDVEIWSRPRVEKVEHDVPDED